VQTLFQAVYDHELIQYCLLRIYSKRIIILLIWALLTFFNMNDGPAIIILNEFKKTKVEDGLRQVGGDRKLHPAGVEQG
jgi:hypothetical protein